MLTKQEREEIAERFRNYDKAEYVTLYSGMYDGLLGEHVPKETTVKKDRMELASRILELCDTSNMVELPVDKDGEVIRVDDTVFNTYGEKLSVTSIRVSAECGCVAICENDDSINVCSGDELTHKKLVTPESLSTQIRRVIDKGEMTSWSMAKLSDIADQLENLGDSDDD